MNCVLIPKVNIKYVAQMHNELLEYVFNLMNGDYDVYDIKHIYNLLMAFDDLLFLGEYR